MKINELSLEVDKKNTCKQKSFGFATRREFGAKLVILVTPRQGPTCDQPGLLFRMFVLLKFFLKMELNACVNDAFCPGQKKHGF